ncbi:hypothetical protein ebA1609 [Aromatoleum aromaticum EbN1]|uniref:General secretion pathway protein M n=1 Tax=Aromatoleum aromaticum (strain DSM 19018 / LMG 30748 / EbN1) TaxID=76114 RepID=Q5P6R2_AROAE|nr:type II secretion system protein GspM [Aromatoleum aromaticum]CAI06999.1 hypothetical protein ebA1609 [Aromatoleum aromaticum EbN1]
MTFAVDTHFPGRDGRFVVASVLVAALAVLALVTYLLLGKLFWAQDTTASIEPRYARLLGLREVGPQVQSSLARVGADLSRYAYPATADAARIGTDMQQRIRQLAEAAGLGVAGSQILPARPHAGFTQIPLKLTVDGSLEGLRSLLAGFDRETPVILVDNLQVNASVPRVRRGQPQPQERLVGQLDLSVLHLQP